MKATLVLSILLFLASCATASKELESAIAYGEITELNQYSPEIDKQLYIRLFQSPLYQSDCYKETHGICQYRYFLSVSTFDEYPETNIFPIKNTGEIIAIEWKNIDSVDTATIEFTIQSFTRMATDNNPELAVETKVLRVQVTPQDIKEIPDE